MKTLAITLALMGIVAGGCTAEAHSGVTEEPVKEEPSGEDVIKDIASGHGKSTYQVLLRWHLQSGVIAIPGSTNPKHIAEDYDIFDFALTDGEMAKIDALERNQRFASY